MWCKGAKKDKALQRSHGSQGIKLCQSNSASQMIPRWSTLVAYSMNKKAANILQLKKQAFLLFAFGDVFLYIARNPAMTGEPKTNVGGKDRHNSCSTQGTELNLCWVHLDDYYHAFPPAMMSTQHLGEQGNLPPMNTASLPTSTLSRLGGPRSLTCVMSHAIFY